MFIIKLKSKFLSKRAFIFLLITIIMLLSVRARFNNQINFGQAHSALAIPTEIFSLWNDTAPAINGDIIFTAIDLSGEWSSAGVYSMFDETNSPTAKLLLQNDDTNLYIGLDINEYQDENPGTNWGCAVYLDRDHNGLLTHDDITIRLYVNITKEYVIYEQYNEMNKNWQYVDDVNPGESIPAINVLVNTAFTSSYFEQANHRQYEIKIPLTTLKCNPGNVTGIGLEAYDDYNDLDGTITWPGFSSSPAQIFLNAGGWGDLCLGTNTTEANYFAQYAIEENANIKTNATGYNNGTFIATADIDGNGDLELIVSSNRTVVGDTNLLAIYDYVSGELVRIWASWDHPTHQSKMFVVQGIATFDFDANGEDELYLCGNNSSILRFTDWNSTRKDFDTSETIITFSANFRGFIDIGDIDNDNDAEIIVTYQKVGAVLGEIIVLEYNSLLDSFTNSGTVDLSLLGISYHKINDVLVANMDDESNNELLFLYQTVDSDSIGTSRLHIVEEDGGDWNDNSGDDLTSATSSSTEDAFGHTIIVGDVDNDGVREIIIIGMNYLKIFGKNTFTAGPPIELLINDGSSAPQMGGGAVIGDIDGDSKNELILGCNNGTVLILNVTDAGSDSLSYTIEWSSDLGSAPGMKDSMTCYDIDADSENEVVFGDNFGQIMTFGKTAAPTITITSPSTGSTKTSTSVQIDWDATDDVAIHHFDVYVNATTLVARVGGSQIGIILSLAEGLNNIEVFTFDVTGKIASDTVSVTVSLDAPEVTISDPANGSFTNTASISISYSHFDRNGDFQEYNIFRNGTPIDTVIVETYVVPLLADGTYNITVQAVDLEGHKGQDTIFIIKDTVNPTIVIDSPTDGSAVRTTTISLEWTADDSRSGIDYFEIRRDGILNATTTSSSQIIALDIDDSYLLTVTAFDVAGNSFADFVSITLDTKSPFVNITSPESGLMTTQPSITVQWDSVDNIGGTGIEYSEVTVNGATEYTGSSTQATVDLNGEGIKDIVVTTYDDAGNYDQDVITVIADSSNPFIEILSPVNKFNTSLDSVTIYWNSADNGSGIWYYEVYVDTVFSHNITDATITSTVVYIPIEKDYNITVKAIDYLSHTFEDSIIVTHNLTAKNMIITDPIPTSSYTGDTQVTIEWITSNLVNLTRFDIYIDEVFVISVSNTTDNYDVTLAISTLAQNITIVAVTTNPAINYSDFRWITLDESSPVVIITGPTNESFIYTNIVYLEWTGSDTGSGISLYNVKIDGTTVNTWSPSKNSQYLIFDGLAGNITVTIEAFDFADNDEASSIILQVYVLLPEYSIDLPENYYSATGTFSFNLTVSEVGLGIAEIIILIDGTELLHIVSHDDLELSPFTLVIDIDSTYYNDLTGNHQLTVALVDAQNREVSDSYTFVIDKEAPSFVGISTIGDNALDATSTDYHRIEIDQANGQTNITMSTRVNDNLGIVSVTLRIQGSDFDQVYLLNVEEIGAQSTVYGITLNISDFGLGQYTFTLTVTDYAGNSVNQIYNIALVKATTVPWILQGNNLIYVSAGSALTLVLIVVFAVTLRKTTVNLGWKREIVIVAYVLNGLPCVYMVNNPEMIQDEMLFGGAMTGIRGVLEEIIGEKSKMEIQSVELGQKRVLICPGNFGDSVLMVNKIKPIHKSRLIEFTKNFESHYQEVLIDDPLLTPDTFRGASILVESHFGISDKMQLVDDCEFEEITLDESPKAYEPVETYSHLEVQPTTEYQEQPKEEIIEHQQEPVVDTTPTETLTIEEMLAKMPPQNQKIFIETIQLTQYAITSLLEKEFKNTAIMTNSILEKLETLLSSTDMPKASEAVLVTLISITQEIFSTLEIGKSGDEQAFNVAAEKVSMIWLKNIGEKW